MHITTQIKIYLFHIHLCFVAPTCVCFQMIKCDNNQQTKEGTNKTKHTIHLLSKLCDHTNILLTFLPKTSSQSASVLTGLTVTIFLLLFPILQCSTSYTVTYKAENPKKLTGSKIGAIFLANYLTSHHKEIENRATREF